MAPSVHCWTQPSPFGSLFVAATDLGVCLIDWSDRPLARKRLAGLGGVVECRVDRWGSLLDDYFEGEKSALSGVDVDLCLVAGEFQLAVLGELGDLAVGATTTYGALAVAVGKPGAAQAVGGAVGANPVPIVVPCHRVLASDGTLGGFSGGLANKRALLAHEGFADLPGGWSKHSGAVTQPDQLTFGI